MSSVMSSYDSCHVMSGYDSCRVMSSYDSCHVMSKYDSCRFMKKVLNNCKEDVVNCNHNLQLLNQ